MSAERRAWAVSPSAAAGRQSWAAIAVVLLIGGQAWAIFVAEIGAQISRRSDSTMLAGEVAGDRTVSQTFSIGESGIAGITIHARPWSNTAGGVVTFELGGEAGGDPYFRTSAPVEAVLAAPSGYTLPVVGLAGLTNRRCRLMVAMPGAPLGAGIGLVANREDSYTEGALFVAGREQWGDLVFRTVAARPTVYSHFRHFSRHRQPLAASPWFLPTLLLVYDLALVTFVCRLFTADR